MRRVSSRPRLVSDGDQAFANATIEEFSSDGSPDIDTDDNSMHVPAHQTGRTSSHRKSHAPIAVDHPCSLQAKNLSPASHSSAGRNVSTIHLQETLSRVSIDLPASPKLSDASACQLNKVSSKRKRLTGRHYYPYYSMPRAIAASNRLNPSALDLSECFTNNGSRLLMNLTDLPEENVIGVSTFLDLQEVRRLSSTSKAMRKILAGETLEAQDCEFLLCFADFILACNRWYGYYLDDLDGNYEALLSSHPFSAREQYR